MRAKVLKRQVSQSDDTRTLYSIYTKDRELFDKGQEYIINFVSKNVSWVVQKALAIQIMTSAMTELGKGIVDAAKFAATTTGFSQEVVRRWAYAYFTALDQYPGSLNDLDLDFIQTELSSERGKLVVIRMLSFMMKISNCLHENTYVQMHTGRVHRTSRLRCSANGSVIVLV